MDQIMKAPVAERCGSLGRVAGGAFSCLLHTGHAGPHAAEPSPGEAVTWHNTVPAAPNPTGFIGPYGLKPDAPYDQQRQTSDYERREARRDAVELAVRALTPIIPAFSGDAIGRAVIELAAELGAYIRNGV